MAAAAAADSAAGGAQQPLWDAAYSGEGLVLGAPPGAASSRGADGDHAAALAAALHDVTGIDRERARALVDAAGPRLLEAGLGPAFDVFRLYVQHAGAARGALDDLARALLEGGAAGVLCAPPADFRAALRFVEDQVGCFCTFTAAAPLLLLGWWSLLSCCRLAAWSVPGPRPVNTREPTPRPREPTSTPTHPRSCRA